MRLEESPSACGGLADPYMSGAIDGVVTVPVVSLLAPSVLEHGDCQQLRDSPVEFDPIGKTSENFSSIGD